uniref:Ig-like domain-containing protein n=1 Tax=Neolamprologus brichardi TaxID=32507 RepID=A0A3Q4HZQ2_NEOBR
MLGALSAAGEDFFAKVGGKVTLKCGVSSYRRSLQWLHGNDLLHSVDQRGFPRRGSVDLARRSVVRQTNLEISSVRETDAGRFTCSADGTRHEHSLSVFSVSVSVSPTADLLLGSEATLQCDVKGLIEGCEVKWRSPIVDSPEWSPTAQLNPVTSSHNGTWECIITCGSDQLSEHLTITVQGNTQILDMQTPVFHCDQKKNKHVFSFPEPPPTTSTTTTASLCIYKTLFRVICTYVTNLHGNFTSNKIIWGEIILISLKAHSLEATNSHCTGHHQRLCGKFGSIIIFTSNTLIYGFPDDKQ